MNVTFDISADDLGPAFKAWAENLALARGKTTQEVVNRVMRYWVSFAMAKIPEGDKGKVERQLMALTREYSRVVAGQTGSYSNVRSRKRKRAAKSAMMDRYRGTVAAAMVAILNWDGARDKARAGDRAGFYGTVGRFIAARKWAVNLHRVGGFIPALNVLARGHGSDARKRGFGKMSVEFQKADRMRGPKYQHPPGLIAWKITNVLTEVLVENFASQAQRPGRPAPVGVGGLAPDAFRSVLPELRELLLRFVIEDGLLTEAAQKAGLNVLTGTAGDFGLRKTA